MTTTERELPHPVSWGRQLLVLTQVELCNWRWSWPSLVGTSIIAPAATLWGLSTYARDGGAANVVFVATGAVVVAVLFSALDKAQVRVVYLRTSGGYEALRVLPVRPEQIVLSVVLAFVLLSLPGILTTVGYGLFVADLSVRSSLVSLLVIVPLVSVPMAALGAVVGSYASSPQQGSSVTLLMTLAMVGFGHVLVQPADVPPAIKAVGWLMPSTYAASAIRQGMTGTITAAMIRDAAVLGALATLSLAVLVRRSRRIAA